MARLIDVSHEVADGLVTYPGLPAPVVTDHLSREEPRSHYSDGTTFQIGRIEMVANTVTYLDTRFSWEPASRSQSICAIWVHFQPPASASMPYRSSFAVWVRSLCGLTGWSVTGEISAGRPRRSSDRR